MNCLERRRVSGDVGDVNLNKHLGPNADNLSVEERLDILPINSFFSPKGFQKRVVLGWMHLIPSCRAGRGSIVIFAGY